MKNLISKGGVALCLALAFTVGCEDPKGPAAEPEKEKPTEVGSEGAVNEDAPTPDPTPAGLTAAEQAALKTEAEAEAAETITVENVDAEVAALEKALEAELAE